MPIGPGTRLGQYEIKEFIGQGAMGLVYRAFHADLDRTAAVKVLQAITPDPEAVARFRHEAQAIARLRHPNIVDVYDFGTYEGTPYMIVEYVPGGSLAGRLTGGMLKEALLLKYLRGIAAGLDYAHAHGVVHRDVKPANVLLTEDDTPVLADFGLAKLLQGSSLKSLTGVTTGTPAYMAPEQVTGGAVGPASDGYSLATIAYELLTGSIPFDGLALMEVLYAQVHREPEPPSRRNTSLSEEVDAVVTRGLAKDPAARWGSATGFVDALTAALYGAPAPALARTVVMAPPVAARVPATKAPAPPPPAAPPPSAPVKKRSRAKRVALVAAVIVVVLLIAFMSLAALARGTPNLTLSSSTVNAGDTVVVTATHVPPNQVGEIQLWSALHTFPFRADGSGNVAIDITVPRDISGGDHLVKLCYGGTCHAQQTLHVVGQPLPVTPSPSQTATPTPSHTAGPTPTPAPSMSVLKASVRPGDSETIGGAHFPGSAVAVYFVQGKTEVALGTATLSGGSFYTTVRIPSAATAGAAAIRVCYTGGCAFSTISVS